jgi:hypothetical protein
VQVPALSQAATLPPILIDEPALLRLGAAGYRLTEGAAGSVRFRWLLPPDWVQAAELPPPGRNGIRPLMGVGDRGGRYTAVLGVLPSCNESPYRLLQRGASPGSELGLFTSRSGPVAERIERRGPQLVVTAAHSVPASVGSPCFLVAALGPHDDQQARTMLRTIAVALSLGQALPRGPLT